MSEKKPPFTEEEWTVFNKCRVMLIGKKYDSGLTKQQRFALTAVQVAAAEYVDAFAPRPKISKRKWRQLLKVREEELE